MEFNELLRKYQDLLKVFEQSVEERNKSYEMGALKQLELERKDEELMQASERVTQLSQERPEVRPVIKENLELKGKNEALEKEVLETRNMLAIQPSVQAESPDWFTDAALAARLEGIFVEVQDWVSKHVVDAPYCKRKRNFEYRNARS